MNMERLKEDIKAERKLGKKEKMNERGEIDIERNKAMKGRVRRRKRRKKKRKGIKFGRQKEKKKHKRTML